MIYDLSSKSTLSNMGTTVNRTVYRLRNHRHKFSYIVVQGMSGVLIGSPVSLRLKVPLIVVRKDADKRSSHDAFNIINAPALDHDGGWLFLDDFISLGATLIRVRQGLKDCLENEQLFPSYAIKPVIHEAGSYQYQRDDLRWGEYRGLL